MNVYIRPSSLLLIGLVAAGSLLDAQTPQQPTIPDLLARTPDAGWGGGSIPSGPIPTVDRILSKADIVVRVKIGSGSSHLSDDQREILTDYTIGNPSHVFQRHAANTPVPGIAPAMTVTLFGGIVNINGRVVDFREAGLPELPVGADCLLMLQRIGDRYFPVGRIYGVFRVQQGKTTSLTRREGFAEEYRNRDVNQVVADIINRSSVHQPQ
jgi:hypothetical protein